MSFARSQRIAAGLVAGALLALAPGTASAQSAGRVAAASGSAEEVTYDVRVRSARASRPRASAARRALRRTLGASGVVDTDPLTGGVSVVAKLDRFLTGPSGETPRSIALDYLGERRAAFGLDSQDLASFELTRRYRSGSGATHLLWAQTYRGIPSFDQGLRANVAADGRLINIGGEPRPDLGVESIDPAIGPRRALESAARSVRASVALGPAGPSVGPDWSTKFDRGHQASLVLFGDARDVRLAWRVLLFGGSAGVYDAVIDAATGKLLYRNSLVHDVAALAFDHFPGAPVGGTQVAKDFPLGAWLTAAGQLRGPNAYAYADRNDDNSPEDIPPIGGTWRHPQTTQFPGASPCPASGCTWNSADSDSWEDNLRQAGTQLFFFVNNFHDYLRDTAGIEFGPSSGNFEGADPVLAEVDDGANLVAPGFPDCDHTNNADMAVPPDGQPARMQMYLFTNACGSGAFDVNGADDAHIVYHEYTHGLSSRLITGPSGVGALGGNGTQSGAMGEAWSDWYAEDYLAGAGFQTDTAAPGEIRSATYENVAIRSQPFDCPVGSTGPVCPGSGGAGPGGYTYGDFGKVIPFPEVHADGEIWVETLWDLRQALIAAHGPAGGIFRARALITDGMRLAPDFPTFLQARAAILQADVNRGFGDRDRIWPVFAARGMGLNATTTGDGDIAPVEDFTVPPPLPPPPPPDTKRPVVTGFGLTNKRFRVGLDRTPRAGAAQRVAPVGTRFLFRLDELSRVVIKMERASAGRKVRRSCRRSTRALRSRKRCTRYVPIGSLTRRNRKVGRHRVSFSGRIGVKALPVGLHRASITAKDAAGNLSRPRRERFRVVRR